MPRKLSKTEFVRMLDENRAPPVVMSELRRLIESRPDILRSKKSTKPGSLLYQKHGVMFVSLYEKYALPCSVTVGKSKIPNNRRKVCALRRGPRIEIRAESLRHKRDYEDLARTRGVSLNALVREVLDDLVASALNPLRASSLTKTDNHHNDKHEHFNKSSPRKVRSATS